MAKQSRGEWLVANSKATGATTNAAHYTRGAAKAVVAAEMMMEGYGGEVAVHFKGAPAGRLVDGHWTDVTNATLANAIARDPRHW